MKERFAAAVISLLALAFYTAVPNVRADDGLTAGENGFVVNETVYDVLDHLGPIVWNGAVPEVGHLTVLWQNKLPAIFVNGCPVVNAELVYERNAVTLKGYFAGDLNWPLQAKFLLDAEGNLVVETSGLGGENGRRFIFTPDSGLFIAAPVCLCWGGTSTTTKRPCTVAECNDPGTQCSTNPGAAQAYCEWRNGRVTTNSK